MSTRGLSADAWGLKAGLERGSVSKFLSRVKKTGTSDMMLATVLSLAKAEGLRPEWLACGSGPPDDSGAETPAPVVESPDVLTVVRGEIHKLRIELLAAVTGASTAFPAAERIETTRRIARGGDTAAARAVDRAATDATARKKTKRT